MFNPFAIYPLNGIMHEAPKGYRDEEFHYVVSVPQTAGIALALGELKTVSFTTNQDSIFVWCGIVVPRFYNILYRIQYDKEYLCADFVKNLTALTSDAVPLPVFPSIEIPPGTLMHLDLQNFEVGSGGGEGGPIVPYHNLQITLTGYKRFATS